MERLFERWTTNTRFRNVHRIGKRECVECVGCCALRHSMLLPLRTGRGGPRGIGEYNAEP